MVPCTAAPMKLHWKCWKVRESIIHEPLWCTLLIQNDVSRNRLGWEHPRLHWRGQGQEAQTDGFWTSVHPSYSCERERLLVQKINSPSQIVFTNRMILVPRSWRTCRPRSLRSWARTRWLMLPWSLNELHWVTVPCFLCYNLILFVHLDNLHLL